MLRANKAFCSISLVVVRVFVLLYPVERPERQYSFRLINLFSGPLLKQKGMVCSIFTARRYASAVYAVALCPSVSPSQVGVLSKRLRSRKQRHTLAQGLSGVHR